jgi:hypothetical protein
MFSRPVEGPLTVVLIHGNMFIEKIRKFLIFIVISGNSGASVSLNSLRQSWQSRQPSKPHSHGPYAP